MIKRILPFIISIGLMSCDAKKATTDYFGQNEPETSPILFGEDIISLKGRLEHGISFSPDSKELAFGVLNKDDSGAIYYASKTYNKWSIPEVFEPLKNESVYLPYFSPNGKSLVYAQSRKGAEHWITDIWLLKKNNNLWVQPKKVNSPISTLARESTACMTLENTLYFSSNRDGNGLADLYYSSPENGAYLNAERIDSICSEADEESIFIAADESFLIFSRYASEDNGPDLFISYRDSKETWTQPIPLDAIINSTNWERRPFVTLDNNFLFFTKMTFNDKGLADSDIDWVSTKKVFKPFVFNPISEVIIKVGKETKITIPHDYFKDIDDEIIALSSNQKDFNWMTFDTKTMVLTLSPNQIGGFEVIFTAMDSCSNTTENKVKIIVKDSL